MLRQNINKQKSCKFRQLQRMLFVHVSAYKYFYVCTTMSLRPYVLNSKGSINIIYIRMYVLYSQRKKKLAAKKRRQVKYQKDWDTKIDTYQWQAANLQKYAHLQIHSCATTHVILADMYICYFNICLFTIICIWVYYFYLYEYRQFVFSHHSSANNTYNISHGW